MPTLLRLATALPVATAEVVLHLPKIAHSLVEALPDVLEQLPDLVTELRVVVVELGRLASPEGELTVLLRELARRAAVETDDRVATSGQVGPRTGPR